MKTRAILLALLIISFTGNSQDWVEFAASESTKPDYELLKSTDTIVEFEIDVPGMFSTVIDTFNRVQIKEHTRMDSAGFPEMPIISYLVAIPSCDSVILNIELLDSVKYTNINIYPAPKLVPDTAAGGAVALIEEFYYERTAYETNAWFPGTITETIDKGAIRAQDVARVLFYPVQFNPVKKEIWTYPKIKITLTFYNASGSIQKDVGIFNEVVGSTLINYNSNGLNASVSCGAGLLDTANVYRDSLLIDQKISNNCDYLIITPDELFYDENIWDLANHRAGFNGFDVVVTRMGAINEVFSDTLNMDVKLKYLIRNTYSDNNALHTYDGKLAYVNLFGDVIMESGFDGVPTHEEGYDVYFTQLTQQGGTYDPYPDLMIGRCSVDDDEQLQNVVTKITGFTPYIQPYKDKTFNFIGYNNGNYNYQGAIIEELNNIYYNYQNRLLFPNDYDGYLPSDWTLDSYEVGSYNISTYYSIGQAFFNYAGHGGENIINDQITYDDFFLPNTPDFLPLVVFGACNTGAFQSIENEDCLGEQFLCSDMYRGAIGFIGSSVNAEYPSIYIIPEFYNSLLNNYSLMLGEALMESKLTSSYNQGSMIYNKYNLLGDPALNILYENAAPLPDLYIKDYHITFTPYPTNLGGTIGINAYIRNNTNIPVTSSFIVNSHAVNTSTQEIIQIGEETVSGFMGNATNVSFFWNTSDLTQNQNDFDIYIEIDTEHQIDEIIETNNGNSNNLKLYMYAPDYPVEVEETANSKPVCFDFYPGYDGEEIVYGENVFSSDGNEITSGENSTNGHTSVGNLYNNDKYQYLTIKTNPSPIEIEAFEPPAPDPVWVCPISQNGSNWVGPIISDLDHDGFEEVLTLEVVTGGTRLICLNHNGGLRWTYDFNNTDDNKFLVCNLGNPFNHIVFIDHSGQIFFLKENEANNELEKDFDFKIPDCVKYGDEFTAADFDKNGSFDFVVKYEKTTSQFLGILDVSDLSLIEVPLLDGTGQPTISDLNNDGLIEIAIANTNSDDLLIYDHELNLLNTINIPDINNSEITSGAFDGDNNNDLVIITNSNVNNYLLNVYDQSGDVKLQTPILDYLSSSLVSDIDHDKNNEIVYSYKSNLYVIDIPDAGEGIGWPGHRGNIRSTGILEQPAIIPGAGETIYWTNTISLAGENIIPEGSTVIIKPGTRIRAHIDASLVVDGILIAEGTENHPISFTADINDPSKGYWQGITVSNHSALSMKNCKIRDAEFGVLFEDNCEVTFEYNHLENNLVGVGAVTSRPILKENIIQQNTTGIGCYDNSSPILTDLIYEQPFKNGIINNTTGILIDKSKISIDYGYNDIYNAPPKSYYIQFLYDPGPNYLKARNNYWGTTDLEDIFMYLAPSASFIIEPVLVSPQSSYVPPADQVTAMMKTANTAMENLNYMSAENTFKEIISQYPQSTEAYLSVSCLFKCTDKSNSSWNNLESYYNILYVDSTYNDDFRKMIFSYINLCKRNSGKFSDAISNYESIILNDPTYNDSVYAVIDIGNTYEEAGNYKSTLGQLSYLVPASREEHVEKTVDLLLSLKPDGAADNKIIKSDFRIDGIFPNPFSASTTVEYSIPYGCTISFKTFDSLGRLVKVFEINILEKGEYSTELNLENVDPGIYYLSINSGNQELAVKKMIIK